MLCADVAAMWKGLVMTTRTKIVLTVVAVAFLGAGISYAVPPAYTGPLGNPEEPALRPYKWLWHGTKAFAYHPVASFRDGNLRTPGLGSADFFIGLRRGSVEMDEAIFRGLTYAEPPKRDAYKQLGAANKYIESNPVLCNVADFIAANYFFAFASGGHVVDSLDHVFPFGAHAAAADLGFTRNAISAVHNGNALASGLIWGAQKISHEYVMNDPEDVDRMREASQKKWRDHRAMMKAQKESVDANPVVRAQKDYVGDRINVKKSSIYTGDLRKLAR